MWDTDKCVPFSYGSTYVSVKEQLVEHLIKFSLEPINRQIAISCNSLEMSHIQHHLLRVVPLR